jgi:hypothetical protein
MDTSVRERVRPRKEHELLRRLEGTWDFETRFVTERGEERDQGVCRSRLDYGGFWIVQEENFENEETSALTTIGWDPGRRAYILTSICSSGPGACVAYGVEEASGRVLRFQGEWTEPAAEITQRLQLVYEFQRPDRVELRLRKDDGRLIGEFVYTRRPA